MLAKPTKTQPKTSVKIWLPIIDKLESVMSSACLRRDAYLNKLLEMELDLLEGEVSTPNTQASYDYISTELDKLDRKFISLAIAESLVTRLNQICKAKKIVRDAFFNRLLLLLVAPPVLIDRLYYFDEIEKNWRNSVWSADKHNGPAFENAFYPLSPIVDPFWAIRSGLRLFKQELGYKESADGVYTISFNKVAGMETSFAGFNCYLSDEDIPGSPTKIQKDARLLNEIDQWAKDKKQS